MKKLSILLFMIVSILAPTVGWAADGHTLDLTNHWLGITALCIFAVSYLFVMAEEFTHLRKSKPVMLAAGLIWGMIGWYGSTRGISHEIETAIRHNLLEYAELMLFLLVAMTYINAMDERNVFASLRSWLVNKAFSLRQLFWITGVLSFLISPIADNLTTALLMGAVVMAVGGSNVRFISIACINIVIAANAGGAFSPFGDITTLMVWQKGIVEFKEFFALFVPSAVNFLVPAAIMHFAIPNTQPDDATEAVQLKIGARRIIGLFLLTIISAVSFHQFLHLPPVIGMLTGLSYLQFFGYYLKKRCDRAHKRGASAEELSLICSEGNEEDGAKIGNVVSFDVFNKIARSEWDTLLFFYGVVLAVGGLGFLGYLSLTSELMYTQWGATPANVAVGILSAIVDNIPVMFAVLTMNPEMSQGQWLLVTLTAGVGGSMLSIGSAAGVALMGQARGMYTFFGHLKWTPVIALGYFASIAVHMWINEVPY